MKNSGHIAFLISTALVVFIVCEKLWMNNKKIGVIQMNKLVYEFKGMKEASSKYQAKVEKWSLESDSLKNRLMAMYDQIRIDSLNRNKERLANDIQLFTLFRDSYVEHANLRDEEAKEADRQMTLGVVNQIQDYINQYAKERGFDVILCNSEQQNVGFAKAHLDITKEVLEFANQRYEGIK